MSGLLAVMPRARDPGLRVERSALSVERLLLMKLLDVNARLRSEFPPDARYLIGVSGGRDSVALLHWLTTLGYNRLIVCHLNHQLRGPSSHADARFVKNLAAKYDVGFVGGSSDVRALARRKRISLETAARDARYSFFANTGKRRHCDAIFLAHHADDLVETFLLNLIRGAGLTGLAAMHDVKTRRVNGVDLTIVRPLLSVWRNEIENYVSEHRLRFREDATNKSLTPTRNRIRHRIIPYLENALGRNIRQNVWRTAIICAEEENWIEHQLSGSTNSELSARQIRALPIALQRRAILKWLRAQNISDVGFDTIERVRSLADPQAPIAKVNLPRDRYVRRRAGRIFVE